MQAHIELPVGLVPAEPAGQATQVEEPAAAAYVLVAQGVQVDDAAAVE